MRLRNKKTGEIIDLDIANIKAQFGGISVIPDPVKLGGDEYVYHSLAELNEEWEDYVPKEPLIKNEKIRKVVRAWAEVNNLINDYSVRNGFEMFTVTGHIDKDDYEGMEIHFLGEVKGISWNKTYTIEELCGEEEE